MTDGSWQRPASRPAPSTTASRPTPAPGAVVPPITLSSTFVQEEVGEHAGFEYARSGNPTRTRVRGRASRRSRAPLHGFAFASGMAAEDAVLRTARARASACSSPTTRTAAPSASCRRCSRPTGIEWTVGRPHRPRRAGARLARRHALVWVETPTNPALTIVDILAVCAVAHERGARVVVDNTFATPFLQRPLELGADIVVHSATKYLGGHSDVVGGFAATNDPEIAERIGFLQNAVGAVPSPFDCYLVLRGIKTLARAHGPPLPQRAGRRRRCSCVHPAVSRRALSGHSRSIPGTRSPHAQMRDFGGMVSFLVFGGEDAALELVARTRLFTLAESLGGVESLIEHPARMTHASAVDSPLAVDPALIRLSVGHRDHRRPRRRPPPGAQRGLERRRLTPRSGLRVSASRRARG